MCACVCVEYTLLPFVLHKVHTSAVVQSMVCDDGFHARVSILDLWQILTDLGRTAREQRLKGMFKIFNVEASFLESAISRSRFVMVDPNYEPFPNEQINTNQYKSV